MRVAIMQPYFLPYIGYFQLIAVADLFIVYDNIKYTKKGWINRNRMLLNDKDTTFTLPLKNASDHLHICEREISPQFDAEKLLNQFKGAYQRAPYLRETMALLESIVHHPAANLFEFLLHSLVETCEHLGIATPFQRSSEIAIDHALKGQDKVLALCQATGADRYINPIGGLQLYREADFLAKGIVLEFLQSRLPPYPQSGGEFVPWLSIIDVMMFTSPASLQTAIRQQFDMTRPTA
ncbi:WbqC family protein [Janthinobacterium sp. UMAB-56]|uniref:WbqC family protein n=1 Tax=Janthinobacterium sp. UMAB-56 TaxID=1365361 RepID=UPI001C56E05E|nr:WbqC family protein [Janthinobacterium sp. UMAB-56]